MKWRDFAFKTAAKLDGWRIFLRYASKAKIADFTRAGMDGPCLEWTANATKSGYGLFRVGDETHTAHRIAWATSFGDIPHGMCVCHKCDNPACIAPSHMFLGTLTENNRDRAAKGRGCVVKGDKHWTRLHPERILRGELSRKSKLTESSVIEIRKLRRAGVPAAELAGKFGVSRSNVYLVISGAIWMHVKQESEGAK